MPGPHLQLELHNGMPAVHQPREERAAVAILHRGTGHNGGGQLLWVANKHTLLASVAQRDQCRQLDSLCRFVDHHDFKAPAFILQEVLQNFCEGAVVVSLTRICRPQHPLRCIPRAELLVVVNTSCALASRDT